MSKEELYRELLATAVDCMQSKYVPKKTPNVGVVGGADSAWHFKCGQCGATANNPNVPHLEGCWFAKAKKALQ